MTTSGPRVGGDIDAFCTRCNLELAHTVLAMVGPRVVKVRCNTCQNDHVFRGAKPPAAPKTRTDRSAPREKGQAVSMTDRILSANPATARPYSPKDSYAVDELIHHPTFGLGVITVVRGDKCDVAFKGQSRTLVHRRPGTAQAPAQL